MFRSKIYIFPSKNGQRVKNREPRSRYLVSPAVFFLCPFLKVLKNAKNRFFGGQTFFFEIFHKKLFSTKSRPKFQSLNLKKCPGNWKKGSFLVQKLKFWYSKFFHQSFSAIYDFMHTFTILCTLYGNIYFAGTERVNSRKCVNIDENFGQ